MKTTAPRGIQLSGSPKVNLLPSSELDRRANSASARRWAAIVVLAVALVAASVVGLQTYNMFAADRLSSEQTRTQDLAIQLAELAPVSSAISARSAITVQRDEAMAGDLAWRPVLDTLASGIPAGSAIVGYAFAAGPAPVGDDRALEVGLTGTITLSSATPIDLVAATAGLRALDPVMGVDMQTLTRDEEMFTYTATVVLDQTVYSGDFAAEQENQ